MTIYANVPMVFCSARSVVGFATLHDIHGITNTIYISPGGLPPYEEERIRSFIVGFNCQISVVGADK